MVTRILENLRLSVEDLGRRVGFIEANADTGFIYPRLRTATAAGATTCTLDGLPTWVAVDCAWLVFEPYSANCEIRKWTGGTATAPTFDALTLPHAARSAVLFTAEAVFPAAWFGAKADGVTDDAAAINQALASWPVGGGCVQLLAGTHLIASAVEMPSNAELRGGGWTSVLKLAADVKGVVNSDFAGGNSNIRLTNVHLDADNQNTSPNPLVHFKNVAGLVLDTIKAANSGHWSFDVDTCTNVHCRDIAVTTDAAYYYDGLHIVDSAYVVIDGLTGTTGDDLLGITSLNALTHDITVNNVNGHSTMANTIKVATEATATAGVEDVTISNVVSQDNAREPILIWSQTNGLAVQRITLTNLVLESMAAGFPGVYLDARNGGTLRGVTLANVVVRDCSGEAVSGRVEASSELSDIILNGFDLQVAANSKTAISFKGSAPPLGVEKLVIQGGTVAIAGTGVAGILAEGEDITIGQCSIDAGTGRGIVLADSDYSIGKHVRILGTRIECDSYGISLHGALATAEDVVIADNDLQDVAGSPKIYTPVAGGVATRIYIEGNLGMDGPTRRVLDYKWHFVLADRDNDGNMQARTAVAWDNVSVSGAGTINWNSVFGVDPAARAVVVWLALTDNFAGELFILQAKSTTGSPSLTITAQVSNLPNYAQGVVPIASDGTSYYACSGVIDNLALRVVGWYM